jgi:glucan endo-1,3-alpha-glucosidase
MRPATITLTALASVASARDVFVHYMAQGLSQEHATHDVQRALSLGVSAFALNVGTPNADWCKEAIERLFNAASGTDFKIFFSLDHYAEPDPWAFQDMLTTYWNHESYYRAGPDSLPFLSTFLDAGRGSSDWQDFFGDLPSRPYFVPMFDQSEGYYTNPEAFWNYWANTLDGSFSWEQAWPGTSDTHSNVSTVADERVMGVAHGLGKDYMMGLSSLQYKHFQGSHWFRAGDVVLPERMEQILALADKPEYVQVQTWNDAGESHYIGELWSEGLTPEILEYANQEEHPHQGWQPLVASFIQAFKDGDDASLMRPRNGQVVAGAVWHHEFLTQSGCSSDRASGSGAALDAVNWAVVAGSELTDHYVQVWSGGQMIAHDRISPGLNYKSVRGVNTGAQVIQVVDAQGVVLAEGGRSTKGIAAQSSGLCNLNFQVEEVVAV